MLWYHRVVFLIHQCIIKVWQCLLFLSYVNISFLTSKIKIPQYSETCLNRTSLGLMFMCGIDRCSLYTGQIYKTFPTLGLYLKFSLCRISVYTVFVLDRCHCTLIISALKNKEVLIICYSQHGLLSWNRLINLCVITHYIHVYFYTSN